MRRCQAVLLALWAVGGCTTGQAERCPDPSGVRQAFSGPTGADVVLMEMALVERPLGDRYVNHGLWDLADEQGVSFERKPTLEANGFRVCQIGGTPPEGLQALLTSPRSCPDPRHVRLHAGTAAPVVLGSPWQHCRFRVHHDGHEEEVDLHDAECLLDVTPRLGEDGRIVLSFRPRLRHGQSCVAPRPQHDASGSRRWEWEARQPEEVFPWLSWELTVAPNEYVVVGTYLDRPDTLGQRCFIHAEKAPRVQRLLVLRTTAVAEVAVHDERHGPPPLALQAGWAARGCSP